MLNDSSSYGDLDTVANALQSFPDRAGNLNAVPVGVKTGASTVAQRPDDPGRSGF